MSDNDNREELTEAQLEKLISQAFAEEMIPTSPEEVRRAEEHASEISAEELPQLPEQPMSTRRSRASGARAVPSLDEARARSRASRRGSSAKQWMHWGVAAMVGAAAATAVLFFARPIQPPSDIQGAGDDGTIVSTPPSQEAKPLVIDAPCDACCGGSACEAQSTECASGRTCVGCQPGPQDRFRIRLGDLSWVEDFQGAGEAQPVICIQAGQTEEECLGDTVEAAVTRTWAQTKTTYSPTQLLDGLRIQLRRQKDRALVAEWRRKVSLTPDTLCKGLAVQFIDGKGAPVARISAFVDDAQFIELARAATPRPLLDLQERLKDLSRLSRIHETRDEGERHFVLSLGPLGGKQLEKVRWQLLDQGQKVEITTGGDYVGEPRQ